MIVLVALVDQEQVHHGQSTVVVVVFQWAD
jgi:hypothetical protein